MPGAMAVPSTATTAQIYATLRAAMLAHVTPGGSRLADFVGATPRIYVAAQPSPPVFPYLTLTLDRTTTPGFNGYRETALLEVQTVGKPESQRALVEGAMDVVDDLMTGYLYAASEGLMVCRNRRRATVAQFSDPAESSVVAVLGQFDLFLWPRVLTAKAD